MENDERRRADRGTIYLEATWVGDAGRHGARVSDLSVGGCYLDTIGQAAVGEILTINVQLPKGDWITLQGKVAHLQSDMGFGIRFTNLSNEQRKFVNQLIAATKPEPI